MLLFLLFEFAKLPDNNICSPTQFNSPNPRIKNVGIDFKGIAFSPILFSNSKSTPHINTQPRNGLPTS